MSLVSSRRMFLKMFGSVVVAAKLPIMPVVAQPVILPPEPVGFPNLPPNVIHVQRGREWKAITELLSMDHIYGSNVIRESDKYGNLTRAYKGARYDTLKWTGILEVGDSQELIAEIMDKHDPERFAISMCGCAYEFDAVMNEVVASTHRWDKK